MSELNKIADSIYRSAFKDGETVVVEDDQGEFIWGKLRTNKHGITLTRPDGQSRRMEWHEIVFMAHDGFPVKEIAGMTYEDAVEFCWKLPTEVFRETLDAMAKKHEDDLKKRDKVISALKGEEEEESPRITFGGGCPFVFEDVYVKALHNKGNNGPEYWGEDDEETLVLESPSGAIMHSFDMSHLFLFDGLTLPNQKVCEFSSREY